MVTAGSEDKPFQDGLATLKNAAIGLAFIAVSWMLVTFVFFVINRVTGGSV